MAQEIGGPFAALGFSPGWGLAGTMIYMVFFIINCCVVAFFSYPDEETQYFHNLQFQNIELSARNDL
jgi:hypothetical protein